ncbi:MAG TPA: acyltransferase family protein [Pseudonocardiaceae bacterium]
MIWPRASSSPRRSSPEKADGSSGTASGYRPELDGLRAVAALLVVIYHIWLGRVSGGVDVFFLISGFLITGQLYRASTRQQLDLRRTWGRMLARLLPAAAVVLVTVTAAGVLFLPENRWLQTIREIFASALFFENWQLAADSVDYLARGNETSVVQHFWSLSVQGQFYLLWPLLVALVALVARRAGLTLRRSLVVTLLVVFAASLAYSVWLTAENQPLAYFHFFTRVWEFALGGLLAVVIQSITLGRAVRVILGWLGVVGLVSCGLALQVSTVFPGYIALWPTLSAVCVLLAGTTDSRVGADRFLASAPLRYLGRISYALYLWHWPVLLFYVVVRERPEGVGLLGGAGIVLVSLVLAVLTHHLVEEPVRSARLTNRARWGSFAVAAAALVPVLAVAGTWQFVSLQKADWGTIAQDDLDHPGARARTPGFEYAGRPDAPLVPPFIALGNDWAGITVGECRESHRHPELVTCSTPAEEPPERHILVVGDSHAAQYLGALIPITERRNWRISAITKGACPLTTDSDSLPGDQSCLDWNAAIIDEIVELGPDAVFTIGTRDVRVGLTERTPPGYVAQWRKLEEAGIPVLAVRDNPRYDFSPAACVEAKGPDAPECSTPRAALLAPEPPYRQLPDLPSNVSFLDFSDYFCDEEKCPPVIGNVLVYIDDNHISGTYMATMTYFVEEAIETALGWRESGSPEDA